MLFRIRSEKMLVSSRKRIASEQVFGRQRRIGAGGKIDIQRIPARQQRKRPSSFAALFHYTAKVGAGGTAS